MLKRRDVIILVALFLGAVLFVTYLSIGVAKANVEVYNNDYFGIIDYRSAVDKDGDGIDDQTDILLNAKEYIETKPQYKSEYYDTGYPTGKYGVCTDVVGYALRNSGYDLMTLVNRDIVNNPDDYDVEKPDINIDFRRVKNLVVYFRHTAKELTTDINEIDQWQGGDIVVFNDHIGIVSDRRNKDGVPYILHHSGELQTNYEEDVLGSAIPFYGEIVGHFRVS